MTDFGHAIGVPAPGEPGRSPWEAGLYGPEQPYRPEPPAPDEEDLRSAHTHARVQADAGDLTGARTTIEAALAAGELRLGRDDPALVPLMVDLATIARRLGNLTEARNQLRRAYAIVVPASGPEHPTSLAVEGRLAAVEYRLGEPTDAYDRHLIDVATRVLGPEHPAVRGAAQRLERTQAAPATAAAGEPPAWPTLARPAVATPTVATPTITTPTITTSTAARPTTPAAVPGGPPEPPLEGDIYEPDRTDEPTMRARWGRGGGVALVVSLSAAVLVAGIVAALQLFGPGSGPAVPDPVTGQGSTPAVALSPAPIGVELTDDGGTVTLTWIDPSDGQIPFVISGAFAGDEPEAIETVTAGQTTTTIYGLNVNFNYCFTVAAIWSADLVRESAPACTSRTLATDRG